MSVKHTKSTSYLKHLYTALFLSLFAASAFKAQIQVVNNILPPDIEACAPLGVSTITANYPPSVTVPAGTVTGTGYLPETIPFVASANEGTNVPLADDASAGPFPIGFTFNYYGTNYNNFYISANGYIGFTPPLPGTFSYDAEEMEDDPCGNNNYPQNAIFGWYQDFNPNGVPNAIRYQTTGTAPNRVLTVYYTNIPFWGGSCAGTSTFYIRIFETTNIIQVHIQNKPLCLTMWQGSGLTGLGVPCPQNPANQGCPAYAYAGADIAQNNVAYQYTPFVPGSTAPITAFVSNVSWEGLQGAGNGTSFAVTGTNTTAQTSMLSANQAPRRYIIKVTYDVPCANDVILVDTFVIRLRQYDPSFTVQSPICLGNTSTIQFTGTPTPPNNATIAWNFGTGANPPTANTLGPHTINWTTTGTKTVTLNISGGGCLPASSTQTVEVTPAPTSSFTVTPQVCGSAASTITYTGNAPGTATYNWDFDGGTANPATGQGPFSITWATPGVKTIRLTVAIGTCVSTETIQTVTVLPAPTSTFTATPAAVCPGAPVTLTYTGNAPATAAYTWNFAGGTANPATGAGPINVTWNTSGVMNVTLQINDNGCVSNTTTVPVTINPTPTASFTAPSAVCPGQNANIVYNGTAGANTYTWDFDGGTIASGTGVGPYNVNWPTAGSKTISLLVTSPQGCISAPFTQTITVNPTPTASFSTTPAGVCVGASISLQHTGTAPAGATYLWSFADGSASPGGTASGTQQINFPSAGDRNLSLQIVAQGCSSTVVTNTISVFPTPTASFTIPSDVCPGDPLTATYTGNGGAGATFNWNFNGGVLAGNPTGPGPYTVSWNTPGNKTVSLVVTENGCASQPFNQNVNVFVQPTSNFTALTPVCENQPSTINYTGNASATANYTWTFNGGTPANPNGSGPHDVTWSLAGTYFLNLVVEENGCTSPQTQIPVVVNPIPTSDFTVSTPVCLDGTSTITYTGNAASNSVFNWNFDEGYSPNQVGPGPFEVSWETPGPKTIRLEVSALGCLSTLSTQTIQVLPLPVVDAGLDQQSCSGASVTLGLPALPGHTYSWSPATGLTDPNASQTQASRQNNLNQPVNYQYILTANDGQCSNTDTVIYTVTAPPFVSFVSPPGQCLSSNAFSFIAEGSFSASADFIWSFGPNSNVISSGVLNPQNISFGSTGSQTITLQVNDGGCLSNLYSADVLVYPDPTVNFVAEVNTGCAPLEVNFNNLSSGPSTIFYTWMFGDGSVSTSADPKYTYTNAGLFDVTLKAKTVNGCEAVMQREDFVRVFPTPDAMFSLSSTDLYLISPDLTITAANSAADSVWYFVNGADTLLGPDHTITLPEPGDYVIQQFMRNEFGCIDSITRNVRMNNGTQIYVPSSFSPNKDGVNDLFKIYGEEISNFSIVVYNRWGQLIYTSYDLDNGWDGTTALSDKTVQSGVYFYRIRATDELGFEHLIEGAVTVVL